MNKNKEIFLISLICFFFLSQTSLAIESAKSNYKKFDQILLPKGKNSIPLLSEYPHMPGLLSDEEFFSSSKKILENSAKDVLGQQGFFYRMAKIMAAKKKYQETFNYLKKIDNKVILKNTDLMNEIYLLLDGKNKKLFAEFLVKNNFFTPYISGQCEFYELNNRKKRAEFFYLVLKENTIPGISTTIIKDLFIHIPEVIELAKLQELKDFSFVISKLEINDFIARANTLLLFGRNQAAKEAIDLAISSKKKLVKDEKCELDYLKAKLERKNKNYKNSREMLSKIKKECAGESLIKASYLDLMLAYMQKDVTYLQEFDKFVAKYPKHGFSDDVLFFKANLFIDLNRENEAEIVFEKIIKEYPDGDMFFAALFEKSFLQAKQKNITSAIATLRKIKSLSKIESMQYDQADYWINRLLVYPQVNSFETVNKNNISLSIKNLETLAKKEPSNIYSWFAYSLLKKLNVKVNLAPTSASKIPQEISLENFSDDEKFIFSLIKNGFRKEVLSILNFEKIESKNFNKAKAMALFYQTINRPYLGYQKLIACDDEIASFIFKENPQAYQEISYPKLFLEEMNEAVANTSINKNFLYGLVAQESCFLPSALSWAGAYGLAQLMPVTAEYFAKKINLKISKEDLFDPKINLKLGATVLNNYSAMFNNNVLGTAAYNAGPSLIKIWKKKYNTSALDSFIEQIPIDGTKKYVKKVLSSTLNYYRMYENNDIPTLPITID